MHFYLQHSAQPIGSMTPDAGIGCLLCLSTGYLYCVPFAVLHCLERCASSSHHILHIKAGKDEQVYR